MKDPCDECIVKVNCTAVCPEKENYAALIKTAYQQNHRRKFSTRQQMKHYIKYRDMLREQSADRAVICGRASRLKRS